MSLRNYGIGKRELRQGSGRGNGNDHFDDLIGSTEFYIYQALDKKAKGYEGLKLYLETQGCEVMHFPDAPAELGVRYETLRITCRGEEQIHVQALKRAHAWAHQRNFLHSFFKPLYQ